MKEMEISFGERIEQYLKEHGYPKEYHIEEIQEKYLPDRLPIMFPKAYQNKPLPSTQF